MNPLARVTLDKKTNQWGFDEKLDTVVKQDVANVKAIEEIFSKSAGTASGVGVDQGNVP
jgi:hypothetical protein